MTTPREDEALVEEVVSAHRERDALGAIRSSPAFHDLDEAGRLRAFDAAILARTMEAALDEGGLSTTARAILLRIDRASGR